MSAAGVGRLDQTMTALDPASATGPGGLAALAGLEMAAGQLAPLLMVLRAEQARRTADITVSPSPRSSCDRSQAPGMRKTRKPVRSVARLPELLSATYRNRVRKLSPKSRNQGVKHLPGSHSARAATD
jgi:hypothetical protein